MAIRLHFWGAAQTVTGSSHHLECAGQNVLLDCGLFQGHRQQAREINEHLALPAEQLNAVVLSHAHIDHSGNLPLLAKQGYRGPIYTTPCDGGSVREDAEGQRAYSGVGCGVCEQAGAPEEIDWRCGGRRGGDAAVHAGRMRRRRCSSSSR